MKRLSILIHLCSSTEWHPFSGRCYFFLKDRGLNVHLLTGCKPLSYKWRVKSVMGIGKWYFSRLTVFLKKFAYWRHLRGEEESNKSICSQDCWKWNVIIISRCLREFQMIITSDFFCIWFIEILTEVQVTAMGEKWHSPHSMTLYWHGWIHCNERLNYIHVLQLYF